MTERLETSEAPHVVVDGVAGDLVVVGWSDMAVAVDADGEAEPTVELVDDAVRVSAAGDALVHVPHGASLAVGDLPGDLKITGVGGSVDVRAVAGDLAVRAVGGCSVKTVAGDLSAKDIAGDLMVVTVAADAAVRRVAGAFRADQIGADLYLSDVDGDVHATLGADAKLFLSPVYGAEYTVVAGADILCVLPEDADVDLDVTSGARSVRIDLPGVDVPEVGRFEGAVGEGGATLTLVAGADVRVATGEHDEDGGMSGDFGAGFGEDFGAWAEEFAGKMQVQVEMVAEQVGERLRHVAESMPEVLAAAGVPEDDAQRISMRVELAGQRAAERAAQHAERAAHKAERRAAKHARRAERRANKHERRHRRRSAPQKAAPGASTDEERLMILRMVEGGKISTEDAERLLRALDDR